MNKKVLYLLLLAAMFFILYLLHMPPSFVFGDAPEFAVASKTLGIAHAPGYPLYPLLAHFFSYFIPVSDYALKCNIFSAFISVVVLVIIFLTLLELKINLKTAFFSVLFFGSSSSFFKQSLISEVYSLNSFFVAILLFCIVHYQKNRDKRFIPLTAFLLGIGFGNHHTLLSLILIAFLYFFIIERNFKQFPIAFLFFILGCSIYIYLPLRALSEPSLNFGDPKTLERFWQVITRWQFGFAGRAYSFDAIGNQTMEFLVFFNNQFYPILILLIIGGIFLIFKENKRFFFVLFAIFLINGILTVYVLNPDENEYFLVNEFLTPSLIVSVCFYAVAIEKIVRRKTIYTALIVLILITTGFKYYTQKGELYLKNNIFAKKLASDTLIILPESAVVIGESDYTLFPLFYLQQIQNLRKDVTVLDADFFMLPWYQEQNVKRLPFLKGLLPAISEHGSGGGMVRLDFSALESFKLNQAYLLAQNINEKLRHEVYFTYDFAEMARIYRPDIATKLAPFGTVYKLFINEPLRESYPPLDVMPFEKAGALPPEEAVLLTPYLPYMRKDAENAYFKMDFERAARLFESIYLIEPNIYNGANLVIVLAEEGKRFKRADDIINGIIENLTVPDPKIYLAKGVLELKKGNIDRSINILSSIESKYPQLCEASFYLFEAYKKLGDKQRAQEAFRRVMQGCSEYYKYRASQATDK